MLNILDSDKTTTNTRGIKQLSNKIIFMTI
jgi:hypothetical protein